MDDVDNVDSAKRVSQSSGVFQTVRSVLRFLAFLVDGVFCPLLLGVLRFDMTPENDKTSEKRIMVSRCRCWTYDVEVFVT